MKSISFHSMLWHTCTYIWICTCSYNVGPIGFTMHAEKQSVKNLTCNPTPITTQYSLCSGCILFVFKFKQTCQNCQTMFT